MMTNLFGAEHAGLLDTIERGVAAVRARHKSDERKLRDDEHVKAFEELFGDQVLAVYQRSTPSEQDWEKHYRAYRNFQKWLGAIEPLPAHAATVGLHLLHLTAIEHKSVAEVRAAADGIVFVNQQAGYHIDGAYIEAAIAVATELANGPGDDGGGETVAPNNPPPPTDQHEPLPMAAAGA